MREVGDTFICYYQNKGDNKYADSKSERYTPSAKDWMPAEIEAFETALKTWDDVIENKPLRKLKIGVFWVGMGGNGPLSVTRSALRSDMKASGLVQAATVAESLWRDAVDKCPPKSFDICVYFNMAAPYSFIEKTDESAAAYYDFRSVAMHELGHAFGFVSLARNDGQFGKLPGALHHTAYDALMTDAEGNRLIDKAFKSPNGVGYKPGDIIYLKGSRLKVFNPSIWKPAASMVHVDLGMCVMSPYLYPGLSNRELSQQEIQLLSLMGWKVKKAERKKTD